MKLNTVLFHQVADAIEDNQRFTLDVFFTFRDPEGYELPEFKADFIDAPFLLAGKCKSAGCICGWTNAVTGGSHADDQERACDLLGISHIQGRRLFFADNGSIWTEYAALFGWKQYSDRGGIHDWTQITANQAAAILRDIADGKAKL